MSKNIGKFVLRTFSRAQSKPLSKDKGVKENLEWNFNKPLMKVLYILFMFCIFSFNHLVEGEVNPVNDFIILHPLYGQKKLVVEFDFKDKINLIPEDEVDVELSSAKTGLIDKRKIKPIAHIKPENRKYQTVFDMKKLSAGIYQIKANVKDAYGDKLTDELVKDFTWWSKELEQFKWLDSKAGITNEVLAPWTPIEVEKQKDGKGLIIKVWGRLYQFNNSPFPTSIETKGNSILAKPIGIIAKVDRKTVSLQWSSIKIEKQIPSVIHFTQNASGGGLNLSAVTQIEYDGMIRVDWKIVPEKSLTLEELTFEIQMPVKYAKYIYTYGFYGKVGFIPKDRLVRSFEPMIWLGDEECGLEWFCESEKDWYSKVTRCIEVFSKDDIVTLQLHLVDKAIHMEPGVRVEHELGIPVMQPKDKVVELSYTFGLQATPVKPVEKDVWDYRIEHTGPGNNDISVQPGVDRLNIPESTFNRWVKHGVRTIAFSENWSDINQATTTTYDKDLKPIYDNALKKMVKECHKHGIQIILYLIMGFSDLEPAWPLLIESCEGIPRNGTVVSGTGTMPPQKVSYVCTSSVWQNYIVDGIDKIMMKEYDIDGLYLDGVSIVLTGCKNTLHGCGYIGPTGEPYRTFPLFQGREIMKRIYTVVKKHKPEGQINFHNSLNMFAPVLSFVTSYWTGEHLEDRNNMRGVSKKDPLLKRLPLDEFRAEYMGYQWGAPAEFLTYGLASNAKDALAISFLHDVPIRSDWIMSPVYKIFDEFGRKQAEWLSYWRNSEYVTVNPDNVDVYVSLYKHPNNGVLAVVCNLSETEAKVKVNLNLKNLKLKDKLSASNSSDNKPVNITDGEFELSLPFHDFKIIWIKEEL